MAKQAFPGGPLSFRIPGCGESLLQRLLRVIPLIAASALPALAFAQVWDPGPSMLATATARVARPLLDGTVLVAGGENGSGLLASSETCDPASGVCTATGPLHVARNNGARMVRLKDGRLLICGGPSNTPGNTAEIYDPASRTWTLVAPMSTPRAAHRATVLQDGRVLVSGGSTGSQWMRTAEIYDPAANTWTPVPNMIVVRGRHGAVALRDGTVLVAGGINGNGDVASAEIYDPASNTWSMTGSLHAARSRLLLSMLPDGRVFTAGGAVSGESSGLADVYDPDTRLWRAAPSMSVPRQLFGQNVLPDGRVLMSGGLGAGSAVLASTEIFDPVGFEWEPAGSLATPRQAHATAVLDSGTVFVAGGAQGATVSTAVASTEGFYTPIAGLWAIEAEVNGQPGRGFQVEVHKNVMVLTVYGYTASGASNFYLSAGAMSGHGFTGSLDYYTGGTSFGGAFKPATFAGTAGSVNVTFTGAGAGTITFPGEAPKAIGKFDWSATPGDNARLTSLAGLWAIDAEVTGQPGRGFQVEVQQNVMVMTVYGYTPGGAGTFYLATAPVNGNLFTAELNTFSGGTSFGGPFQSAVLVGSAGTVTFTLIDSTHATIAFPGEPAKSASKFKW